MADLSDEPQSQSADTMQESWVDVQQGEGTLVHSRSKEELEKLLASAASEEEMSDSDTLYRVTFQQTAQDDEEEDSPIEKEPPKSMQTQTVSQSHRLTPDVPVASGRSTNSQTSCRELFWCVPVLLLTHLAVFGIGYYLGKRVSVEPPLKLLHI